MCGIAGVVGPLADSAGRAWLDTALAAIDHRGPDGHGRFDAPGVALGHTRLAIRDLSEAANQPMQSASGDHWLTYNGEIYAFEKLASRLKPHLARQGGLRTTSDTEVVLEALAADGAAVLEELNGMFALGWWQVGPEELVLVRDPIGIKPLYVAELGDSLAFCSELSPLLKLNGIDASMDLEALELALVLGVVPAPWTLCRGVRQLLPGELLRWRGGRSERRRYTPKIGTPQPDALAAMPKDAAAREAMLESLLDEVVGDQLVSDVPIGVLLSGGVDSSVVAAAASRRVAGVKTFSVVHRDPAYDEREAARAVAAHLGTEHIELELPEDGLTDDELLGLVDHHGDPFADSSSLPTRRLAREVRSHVTVALSGDGGDELFAGYPRYWQAGVIAKLTAAPRPARRAAHRAGAMVAQATGHQGARRAARAFLSAARPVHERAIATKTWFWPDEVRSILRPDLHTNGALKTLIEGRAVPGFVADQPDGCHRMEQHLVLPDDMLTKVDRMTMAESLEIRPPLLDMRIARFAAALPFGDKLGPNREGKAILKRIARRRVPPWVIDRPKKGFALPLLDFGGAALAARTRWALEGEDSPLRHMMTPAALAGFTAEFQRRGDGRATEDSAYRRMHRQWLIVLLALSVQRLGLT